MEKNGERKGEKIEQVREEEWREEGDKIRGE